MFTKKFFQINLIQNKNLLQNLKHKNLIFSEIKNFTNLNLNFSHYHGTLPLDTFKLQNKQKSQPDNLTNLLLRKLSKNILFYKLDEYTDSLNFLVMRKNLSNDLDQLEINQNSLYFNKELKSIVDSLKYIKPIFINELIEEIIKNTNIPTFTFAEIETQANELSQKSFLNEIIYSSENLNETIIFSESLIKSLFKYGYYDYTHNIAYDDNKIYQLKKLDVIRSIYENINFDQISNMQFVRILPMIIILQRIFNFSSLILNTFNSAINRAVYVNDLYLTKSDGIDSRILLIKRNKNLLYDYIKYVFINHSKLNNLGSNVFPNFESLLSKLLFVKDIITENGDINDILFILTENIVHYSYCLEEFEKMIKLKKFSKGKGKNFNLIFKEFLTSYLNYVLLISYQKPNIVKNIDINLLKKFTSALILLKKNENDYTIFKEDLNFNVYLNNVIRKFLYRTLLGKQSLLVNFLNKSDGVLILSELDHMFDLKDLDPNINIQYVKENTREKINFKEENIRNYLHYCANKYDASQINKLIMNIIFNENITQFFTSMDLKDLVDIFIHLEKFKVKYLSDYLSALKTKINSELKSIDIVTHFKMLYISSKLNQDLVALKSPLYITFLLKLNENNFFNDFQNNFVKLSWVFAYYTSIELKSNVFLDEALKGLIKSIKNNTNWLNMHDINDLFEILIMVNDLKSYNINVPKEFLDFFDVEVLKNLLNYHLINSNNEKDKNKLLNFFEKEKVNFEINKLTNIFYIDFILEIFEKVKFLFSIFFRNIL